jgi:hypothetical protein
MARRFADFFVYGIIIVGIGILVRPNSQGPKFVTAIGNSLSNFAKAVSSSGG